jgi:hypothetical protein
MDMRQVEQVLDLYEQSLKDCGADPEQHSHDTFISEALDPTGWQDHALSMIGPMREMISDNRREKLFRWLGFIQGVFWANSVYTIEQMRHHNTRIGA